MYVLYIQWVWRTLYICSSFKSPITTVQTIEGPGSGYISRYYLRDVWKAIIIFHLSKKWPTRNNYPTECSLLSAGMKNGYPTGCSLLPAGMKRYAAIQLDGVNYLLA
jgi:hypothetical protein